jgi:ABC-type phosphate transport system substrate-binding protein
MRTALIFAALFLLSAIAVQAQIAVIVHKSVPDNSLDAGKLADVYSLKTQKWTDGARIVVFDLKTDDAVREKFYKFIEKNPADLRKTWMRLQLTGEGKAPDAFKSEDEILQQIASTSGAIGYVSAGKVTDAVKVIARIE